MFNFLYNVAGKTELKIKQKALENMSLPELMQIMKAEQDGKITVIVDVEEEN